MKKAGALAVVFILCVSGMALVKRDASIGVEHTVNYFVANAKTFTASLEDLQTAIKSITTKNTATLNAARQQLALCRAAYKRIEFFVDYFFEARICIFNSAPVYEVEEPFMEYQSPIGLQVVEELLFNNHPESKKAEMLAQTGVLLTTAKGLPSYLYGRKLKDDEILESMRLEIIRIITLGITGYDAPQLKTGITEAGQAIAALQENLLPYLDKALPANAGQVNLYLNRCLQLLAPTISFNGFNRLQFLTEAALPLQEQLGKMIADLGLQKSGVPQLNYSVPNLYTKGALNMTALGTGSNSVDTNLIALGRKLFFEKSLSGNGKRSCATCHRPQHYFTDGLDKSVALNEEDKMARNAPSILYAAYQHGQFWDARSPDLEAQAGQVLLSPVEMHAAGAGFAKSLKTNPAYRRLFSTAFYKNDDSLFQIKEITKAIAAYESSLPVMTSAFDNYMAGNKKALSQKQVRGFNLFMGKAQCGTCHFAPLFNGLLPPKYNRTELESLGMIATAKFNKPVADKDSGRYHIFPIEFYAGAFKTPTVRNSAKTAPYMHNGALRTLAQVIDFYDRGGGNGLGLKNPYQTLSDKPLHLTAKEKGCLIAFLRSLTDKEIAL